MYIYIERAQIISIVSQGGRHLAYRRISDISRILFENNIIDHSDVVGASPVGAAPTTSLLGT